MGARSALRLLTGGLRAAILSEGYARLRQQSRRGALHRPVSGRAENVGSRESPRGRRDRSAVAKGTPAARRSATIPAPCLNPLKRCLMILGNRQAHRRPLRTRVRDAHRSISDKAAARGSRTSSRPADGRPRCAARSNSEWTALSHHECSRSRASDPPGMRTAGRPLRSILTRDGLRAGAKIDRRCDPSLTPRRRRMAPIAPVPYLGWVGRQAHACARTYSPISVI